MTVFEFRRATVGIDPATVLMSATSFDEYDSVAHQRSDLPYAWEKLKDDNSTTNSGVTIVGSK